jgi:hypothetical protein
MHGALNASYQKILTFVSVPVLEAQALNLFQFYSYFIVLRVDAVMFKIGLFDQRDCLLARIGSNRLMQTE